MKKVVVLHFKVEYHVSDSDHALLWIGDISHKGEYREKRRISMVQNGGVWEAHIETYTSSDGAEPLLLSYNYLLEHKGIPIRYEAPIPHIVSVTAPYGDHIHIEDRWIDPSPLHRLTRYPFASSLSPSTNNDDSEGVRVSTSSVIAVHLPHVMRGELLLCGSSKTLGSWDPGHALSLSQSGDDYYFSCEEPSGTEYKFVFRQEDGTYLWEKGSNRSYRPDERRTLQFVYPPEFDIPSDRSLRPYSGTVLPLFSLRSSDSFGIGDLDDAVKFLEWLRETHQSVYQLLPIYDTTFTKTISDTYPYNSITTYGLHPAYLSVRTLPFYETAPDRKRWEQEAQRLNTLSSVSHTEALDLKWDVIRYCFAHWYKAEGHKDEAFLLFLDTEGEDLTAYCLFCVLRDRHPGFAVIDYPCYSATKREWDTTHSIGGKDAHEEMTLHAFVQYHLYGQLTALSKRAKEYGILLKGDLPIGVGRNSVAVWMYPELFNTDMNAGAPPDAFSEKGQIWGFPTYNWTLMQTDDYRWWKHRLSMMGRYFEAIRIDHILGFFRIWSVPKGEDNPCLGRFVPALGFSLDELTTRGIDPRGIDNEDDPDRLLLKDDKSLYHPRVMLSRSPLMKRIDEDLAHRLTDLHDEYFYHRNEALWRQTATERIRGLLSASRMLLCAEDLGMLPHSVSEVLSECEILSLEILRMPKKSVAHIVRKEDIPLLSVLSTSTHDMPTLRAWWQELSEDDREELGHFYGTPSSPSLSAKGLVSALFETSALFVILPLQDWCVLSGYGSGIDPRSERINIPEDAQHIWNYRMCGTIETLRADTELKEQINALSSRTLSTKTE